MRHLVDRVRWVWTFGPLDASRRALWSIGIAAWISASLASATQGFVFAAYRGREQDWWPTLGYTAAIFSVWMLLAPVIVKAAGRVSARASDRARIIACALAGLPVAVGLHLFVFVTLFWPVYGSSAATPFHMVKPVLLANLDKAVFAYAAIIAFAVLRERRATQQGGAQTGEKSSDAAAGLWIRVAGGTRFARFDEIDLIAAAGDYAEIHAGERRLLTDRSLADLAGQLPKDQFARIHRGTIVRLDRIRQVERLGRGDANLLLLTGERLRLSRRYRENVARHLPL